MSFQNVEVKLCSGSIEVGHSALSQKGKKMLLEPSKIAKDAEPVRKASSIQLGSTKVTMYRL